MQHSKLAKTVLVLFLLMAIVVILVYARPFLVPLTFAAILSMLLLPIAKWLQKKGVGKALATVLAILAFVAIVAGIISFISWQVTDLAKDASKIEQQLTQKLQQLKSFVSNNLGISGQQQQQLIQKQQQSGSGQLGSMVTGILTGTGTLLANFLLVLVYAFLFIFFHTHLKNFVLKIVPRQKEQTAITILHGSQRVVEKYLTGMGMMIACLWIMYGIGFSVVGVKNAVFFAILCGLLEIIPFVGNLSGTLITMLTSLAQGGNTTVLLGIAITYAVVQFIQTYLLEPLVVGKEVSINPLFTIVCIIAGEFLWGIPGMILAIPLLGIAKVVFDNIEELTPYGYLLGEDKEKKGRGKKET